MTAPGATGATAPRLLATCWTTAGGVRPLDEPEVSPLDPYERVRAVAADGWYGMGFAQGDLERIEQTIGFADLAAEIRRSGIQQVEVELLTEWWYPREHWGDRWALLLRAADALGAEVVKIGSSLGTPTTDLGRFVAPARSLAREAGSAGVRLALEPLPFGLIGSLPAGAALVDEVDVPAFGLCVDAWHVFRAGTPLSDLASCLRPGTVHSVELNDADGVVVGSLFDDTRDRRRYPGEGSFDLAGFVDVVRGTGFDGPWGVEMLSDEHRRRPLREGLAQARTSALALLEHPAH